MISLFNFIPKDLFQNHVGFLCHCRSHDYENFLATLLINGQSKRRGAFAVRAFNVEIAKVAGSVSCFSPSFF